MISKRTEEAEALAREADAQIAGRKSAKGRLGAEVRAATSGQTNSEDRLMERGGRTQQLVAGVPASG